MVHARWKADAMPRIKTPDPHDVAYWRYEQIEEALATNLTHELRGKILRRISRTPTRWPSGMTKPIPIPTAYRWLRDYLRGGLEALRPKRRSDRGVARAKLPDTVVQEALRQLTEDPGLSFTFLLALLHPLFPKVTIPRSTLQQRLTAHPDYLRIKRLRHHQKRRTRFVARAPHEIWHTDAKGPVSLPLAGGKKLVFHILTILDDASRAVLAAIVSLHADLAAAVRVFRTAANRWGLPNMLYADRASVFDSRPFRMGLAQMGSHRIATKPRNPEANGKIEAYHRTLVMWFCERLPRQVVVDLVHLQQLLDGVIHGLYQTHRHRGLKLSPAVTLGGRVSSRVVPPTRLVDAFRQKKQLKAHPKTGEVEIAGTTYLVPDELRGQKLTFLLDPPGEVPPLLLHPTSGDSLSLQRAAIKPDDLDATTPEQLPLRWGAGNLQALYDNWQGKRRPLAEPGFGLPELYALLAKACRRYVPASDAEAALVQRIYRDIGPLPQRPTEQALAAITEQLGTQRPVKTYLDALAQRVRDASPSERT
jgi:transposase InsO family protein